MEKTVADFMTPNPITIDEKVPVKKAIEIMRNNVIGCLLIVKHNKICGIFTERDILTKVDTSSENDMNKPIRNFMSEKVIKIQTGERHYSAYSKMKANHFRHLPVFEGELLKGIISIRDLTGYLENVYHEIEPDDSSKSKELVPFQLRHIQIMTELYKTGSVSDEIFEKLRESEMDYFSIINKCRFLEHRVNIDEKTNLLKYNNEYLLQIVKSASRFLAENRNANFSVSFVRFDIDDFSEFNNLYGHNKGDLILIKLADFLKSMTRPTDYVIRFGGEEFDIILPGTNIKQTCELLDKIYSKLKTLYLYEQDKKAYITASAGVSGMSYSFGKNYKINKNKIIHDYENIQNQADNALYEAKYLGKNRYAVYDPNKNKTYKSIRENYIKSP